MDHAFITCALREVRRGLVMAMVDANLDHEPETLTQAVARRVKARMKELEIILRRLIVLLALSLTLPPPAPRPAAKPAGEGQGPIDTKSQHLYSIALTGQTHISNPDDPGFPEGDGKFPSSVSTAPLLRRFQAFARILKNPDRYARRVARTLERQRERARPRPYIMAMPTHRLHPELGLLAAGLPQLLAAAFDRWTGSG